MEAGATVIWRLGTGAFGGWGQGYLEAGDRGIWRLGTRIFEGYVEVVVGSRFTAHSSDTYAREPGVQTHTHTTAPGVHTHTHTSVTVHKIGRAHV